MNATLAEIKDAVQQGDLERSLSMLRNLTSEQSSRFHNEVILQTARVNKVRTDERQGMVSFEKLSQEKNRIIFNLLDLIDAIEQDLEDRTPELHNSTVGIADDDGELKDQLGRIDDRLQELKEGQYAIREDISGLRDAVLAQFGASEKRIVAALIDDLDQHDLALVQTVLNTIEQVSEADGQLAATLAAIEEMLPKIQGQLDNLADFARGSQLEQAAEIVRDPTLEVKHKLKVAIPIIPMLLSYETELEISAGVNLKRLWDKVTRRG